MSIQTQIARISGAVTNAKSALAAKGVTVPEGANVESLAGLIGSIETGGGMDQSKAIGAFESFSAATEDSFKKTALLPEPFSVNFNSTANAASERLTLSIEAEAGDTIIVAFSHRGTPDKPTVESEGWEELMQTQENFGSPYVGVKIAKYTAGQAGLVTFSAVQSVSSNRLFGIIVNVKDAEVLSAEYVGKSGQDGSSITSPACAEGHFLAFIASRFGGTLDSYAEIANDVYTEPIKMNWTDALKCAQFWGAYFPKVQDQNDDFLTASMPTNDPHQRFICMVRIEPRTYKRIVMASGASGYMEKTI